MILYICPIVIIIVQLGNLRELDLCLSHLIDHQLKEVFYSIRAQKAMNLMHCLARQARDRRFLLLYRALSLLLCVA